jgi:hypothetical protein
MRRPATFAAAVAGALLTVTSVAGIASAGRHFSAWGPAEKVDEIDGNSSELNTPYVDGCPIVSPDGKSLYMASNRPRYIGDTRTDLDIWVAHRRNRHAPFRAPQNVASPVNSTYDDFCPTPVRGNGLFFVSRRPDVPGACGGADMYFTRFDHMTGWSEPEHLACAPAGPNTPGDEMGPSYVKVGGQELLYFSSGPTGPPTSGHDIFVSEKVDGSFGPAVPVAELNTAASDIQPNVRKDGLEVVFSSNRAGTLGAQDVWVATRANRRQPWSAPVNVGSVVNTGAAETRPSLSKNGKQLLFGRAPGPEGSSDIYVTTRR